ncbi:MAG: phenylacetate--CoA ligase family protein [Parahaliea sp.]
MSFYTRFVSSCIFPLHEALKKHTTVAVRQKMERDQWLPMAQIEHQQGERLRYFLQDINEYVPYYRKMFEAAGFDPKCVQNKADLAVLPLLDKSLIREHFDQLKATNANSLQRFNTGGSSGEPLIFLLGSERVSHDVAAKWRATRWWDVDIGDPELVIWGSPIELGAQDRVRLLRDRLLRTELLSAFDLSDEKIDKHLQVIRQRRPAMLFGYPSAIGVLAESALKKGLNMDDLGIRVVFVTSERLYDYQREVIERCFGCPVANGYGGRDAGFIAHQCPQGQLHITADDIVLEIVDPEGRMLPAGEQGEIVVTHMATRDFPFVRYRTGDIGVLSPDACSCGRGLPVLASVEGRSTDFVVAENGALVHGLALIYILRDMPEVDRFKIIQESLQKTVVQLVPNTGFDERCREQVATAFRQRLGAGVDVTIEEVDDIAAEASGKFRYVISRVERPGA